MLGTILGVIWLIIKIILWILLGIIGLLLLLILLVVFVPFRYQLKASKYEEIHGKVRVTYLLRFIRVFFDYSPEGYFYKVKVLFFTVLREDTRKKAAEEAAVLEEPLTQPVEEVSQVVEVEEVVVRKAPKPIQEEKEAVVKTQDEGQSACESSADTSEKQIETTKPEKKKKKKKKDKNPKEKKPKDDESGLDTAKRFIGFLGEEKNHGVLKFILGKIFKAIGSVLPRSLEGNIHFGTGDPATTGYIFGGASIFYPKYKDSLILKPNFDESIIEGEVKVAGKITLGVFVWMAIRIYLDRRVRRLIKEVRKTI